MHSITLTPLFPLRDPVCAVRLDGRGARARARDRRGRRGRRRRRAGGHEPARRQRAALRRRGAEGRQAEPDPERLGAAGRRVADADPRLLRRARPLVVARSPVLGRPGTSSARSCAGTRPRRCAPTRSRRAPRRWRSGRPSTEQLAHRGRRLAHRCQRRRVRRPGGRDRATSPGRLRRSPASAAWSPRCPAAGVVPGRGLPAGRVRAAVPEAGRRLRLRHARRARRAGFGRPTRWRRSGSAALARRPSVALGERPALRGSRA